MSENRQTNAFSLPKCRSHGIKMCRIGVDTIVETSFDAMIADGSKITNELDQVNST